MVFEGVELHQRHGYTQSLLNRLLDSSVLQLIIYVQGCPDQLPQTFVFSFVLWTPQIKRL